MSFRHEYIAQSVRKYNTWKLERMMLEEEFWFCGVNVELAIFTATTGMDFEIFQPLAVRGGFSSWLHFYSV